jgi:hypothetical protein
MALLAALGCKAGSTHPLGHGTAKAPPRDLAPDGPALFFADVEAGATRGGPGNQGVPISLFGKGFGATRGSSRVTIGGVEVASYLAWGTGNAANPYLDMIVAQPGPLAAGGPIVVTVGGKASNADLSFTPLPAAAILVVSASGRDDFPCTEAQPCATILHAVNDLARPGDAVLVRGPSLDESEVWIRDAYGHSGAPGAPKVVRNWPGETVTLPNASRPFIVDANFITFSGFAFQNGKSIGLGSEGNQGNKIVNSTFGGNIGYDAVGSHGSDHLIAGNVCDLDGSSTGTQGHCYYVSHGSRIRLLWNVARGSWPGYGIHIYDQQRSTPDIRREIHDVLVEGNVLTGSSERSGMIIAMDDEGGYGNNVAGVVVRNNLFAANNHNGAVVAGSASISDLKFYANTFFQNGRQGLHIEGTAARNVSGVEIRNNLFDIGANGNCRSNCSWYSASHLEVVNATGVTVSGNGYSPAPVATPGAADPAPVSGTATYLDPATLDLRPATGSFPVDRGAPLPVARDFRGMARPQGAAPDLGAFERGPGDP